MDRYVPGSWNVVCGQCNWKYKSHELRERWDKVMVCAKCWEPRHVLDFFKPTEEKSGVPWTQPDTASVTGYDAIVFSDSPYTLTSAVMVLDVDATLGNITITLPAASAFYGANVFVTIRRTDSTSNTVTISRAGSDLIDGGTSITISGLNTLRLTSNDVTRWTTYNGQ